MDLIREFAAPVDALDQDGVEYAVCGGIAVTIHGYVRTTKDIDLMIRREDADRAVQLAARLGFLDDSGNLSFDSGTQRERTVRRIIKIEGRDLLMLDLLLVSPILEPAWQTRIEVEWEGRRVSIVSRDGLAPSPVAIRTLLTSNSWGFAATAVYPQPHDPVDMSPEVIAQRLRDLQQLYMFSMSLTRARFFGETQTVAESKEPAKPADESSARTGY